MSSEDDKQNEPNETVDKTQASPEELTSSGNPSVPDTQRNGAPVSGPNHSAKSESQPPAYVVDLISELYDLRKLIARYGVEPIRTNIREERLEEQIRRLEEKQIVLDRRRLSERRSEVERIELDHRARKIDDKLNRLADALERVRVSGDSEAWSANIFGRFSDTLRELLRAERSGDLELARDDRDLLRGWLTYTVRRRRAALREVSGRVEQARKYVLHAIGRARSEQGVEAALRSRAMLIMAQNAQRDAQLQLQQLAHVWDDLADLANDPKWFGLAWRETQNAAARLTQGTQNSAAEELLKTLAARIDERRIAVQEAPYPWASAASG